ncbi:MAG: S-layer homology domain-containing protein, partial [Bacteroidales bacterium]|nr:S-layer homology domain-containing protein [Bacteroidales bacterium]
ENGITTGKSDQFFAPYAVCTRAETVTFLWRAAGKPTPASTVNPFIDVAPDAFYYTAVLWAAEQGITTGTSADTFSPNETVSRGQMVTFLWRAAGKPAANAANPFADVAADAYYTGAVLWAVARGITNGTSATTFSPDAGCTRAQIVTFLYRFYA